MVKRLPPKTPGTAHTDGNDSNSMLPMDLHRDAVIFYARALDAKGRGDQDAVDRYVRASIMAAFSSLEAQLNMAAASHAKAHADVLEPIVRDVLREEETFINDHGRIAVRRRTMRLAARISFFAAFLSGHELDRSGQLWVDLNEATELRDGCVHPKPPFPFEWDAEDARHVINAVGAVQREISRLAEIPPMRWWVDAADLVESLRLEQGTESTFREREPLDFDQGP